MSTAVLTDRLEPAQHTAAKVAGFIYLSTMVPCSAICGSSRASFLEDWLPGNLNTPLSRKRHAMLHLRQRWQSIYDEFTKG
jgi:hypothetical protein